MQQCVAYFMDSGFHGLEIAHIFLNCDILFRLMIIAFCFPFYLHHADWNRGNVLQCFHERVIKLYAPGKFRYFQFCDRFSLCLADIKYRCHTEPWNDHLHDLCFRLTVIPDHRLFGHRVDLFNLLFLTDGCRCDDLDSFFPTFYMAVKFLLPCLIPCHQCCFRFLHGDQKGVIKTVIMELGHGIQIFCISLRSKDFFYSLLQPFRYFF